MPIMFSDPTTLYPVLRRAELFTSELRTALTRAFAQSDLSIRAILVPLWIDEEQVLPCLAPRFAVPVEDGFRLIDWADIDGPASSVLPLADVALTLMRTNSFHAALEELSNEAPFGNGRHHAAALICPNSTIISHDDISMFAREQSCELEKDPAREDLRAPICTIALPRPLSAHAAIDEHRRITEDLDIFRSIEARALEEIESDLEMDFSGPDIHMLAACQ